MTLKIKPPIKNVIKFLSEIIDANARRRILTRAVLELKDRAAAYPPAGAWNSAPGVGGKGRWYQRQWGARWSRKDGTTGGRNTSERLQKSWRTEIQRRDEFTASAFTDVSYAPFLFDPAQRVRWAAGHGWLDMDEIAEEYAPRFEKIVLDEIDNQLKTKRIDP